MKMLEFVFKCIYDKLSLPSIFRDYFERSKLTLNYDSRRKNDLFVPMSNSTFGLSRSIIVGVKFWNKLPNNMKTINNLFQFKKSVKTSLTS